MQDLEAMSTRLAALQHHVSWLGGLTNHQDAFGPLYRMLLGLHAAAAGIQRDEELCAFRAMSLPRIARALLSCGMQPLIGNLLHVVQVYDAASSLTCGRPVMGSVKHLQLT
jgi:hypothetical protein